VAGQESASKRAIRDVEQAVLGDRGLSDAQRGANPVLATDQDDAEDDRTAHTRATSDAADEVAVQDPDAESDLGAEDDTYKRTRWMRTR